MNEIRAEIKLSDADRYPRLIRPRIELLPGLVIGPGKVELLQAIARRGSIAAAARELGMGYKRAWSLLEVLNKGFGEPVVRAKPGGLRGGGAVLTTLGSSIVERFLRIEAACGEAAAMELSLLGISCGASPSGPQA
jgi:molybdate transport system regulatory protein